MGSTYHTFNSDNNIVPHRQFHRENLQQIRTSLKHSFPLTLPPFLPSYLPPTLPLSHNHKHTHVCTCRTNWCHVIWCIQWYDHELNGSLGCPSQLGIQTIHLLLPFLLNLLGDQLWGWERGGTGGRRSGFSLDQMVQMAKVDPMTSTVIVHTPLISGKVMWEVRLVTAVGRI